MPARGRSGKVYSDAVIGKSGSELIRMGYSTNEIEDIRRAKKIHHRRSHRHHHSRRRRLSFKQVIIGAMIAYGLLVLVGAAKISKPYDTLRYTVAADPSAIQVVDRDFFAQVTAMAQNPKLAWSCVWSSEEEIFMDLSIMYLNEIGADATNMEWLRGMYDLMY